VILAVVVTGLPLVGLQGGAHAANEPDDVPVAYQCDPALPVHYEDACDSASSLPDPDAMVANVIAYAGDRYSGAWIDRDAAEPAQVFALRDLTLTDRVYIASLAPGSSQVVAVDALFSMKELDAVANAIGIALEFQGIAASIDSNEKVGAVTVGVLDGHADAVRRSLGALLAASGAVGVRSALRRLDEMSAPLGKLVKVSDDEAQPFTDSRTTYPLHNGGLSLGLENIQTGVGSGCTSGFTIVSGGGTYMGLTAGHCASGYLTENISIGGDHLSRSGQNSWLGVSPRPSDSMRYSLADPSHKNDNIFVNGSTLDYRDVNAPSFSQANLQTGTRVCFQGVSSDNNNCGYVEATDIQQPFNKDGIVKEIRNIWSMRFPVIRGDSGGPVYHVRDDGTAMPAGIVTGGGDVMFFSHIGPALANIDASLYYR
jgi:hypothetical protein